MADATKKKKRRKIPKGGHRVRDAAGRPLIGMFHNSSAGSWSAELHARPIALVYPEVRETIASGPIAPGPGLHVLLRTRRVRAECVRCVDSTALYEARYIMAPTCAGFPEMPLLPSLRKYSKFWWVNERGGLERNATEYEARLPDLPPREGWTLASAEAVASLIAHKKQLAATDEDVSTDTERAERAERERLKAKVHAQRLATAREMVTRYERRIKLATTLLKKWKRRAKALAKKAGST